jgi:hypothetical protein
MYLIILEERDVEERSFINNGYRKRSTDASQIKDHEPSAVKR